LDNSVATEITIQYVVRRPRCAPVLTRRILDFFLPRDAMRKRGLCCRPVSVCLAGGSYPDSWRYHQTSFSTR